MQDAQAIENDYALLTANLKDFDGSLVYELLVREDRLPATDRIEDRREMTQAWSRRG